MNNRYQRDAAVDLPDRIGLDNGSSGYQLVNGRLTNQEWVAPSLNTTADGALGERRQQPRLGEALVELLDHRRQHLGV
jgi:hypothetical protein